MLLFVMVVVGASAREATRKGALRASERSRSVRHRPTAAAAADAPVGEACVDEDVEDDGGGGDSMEAMSERVLSRGSCDGDDSP